MDFWCQVLTMPGSVSAGGTVGSRLLSRFLTWDGPKGTCEPHVQRSMWMFLAERVNSPAEVKICSCGGKPVNLLTWWSWPWKTPGEVFYVSSFGFRIITLYCDVQIRLWLWEPFPNTKSMWIASLAILPKVWANGNQNFCFVTVISPVSITLPCASVSAWVDWKAPVLCFFALGLCYIPYHSVALGSSFIGNSKDPSEPTYFS